MKRPYAPHRLRLQSKVTFEQPRRSGPGRFPGLDIVSAQQPVNGPEGQLAVAAARLDQSSEECRLARVARRFQNSGHGMTPVVTAHVHIAGVE